MFNWEDLKVFLAAYREGSIGRAAEFLGVSGSTVSRRLSALEDALGQALFVRSPDGLRPTEAGEMARLAAEETERSASQLGAIVGGHGKVEGLVRVAVSDELLASVLIPQWTDFSQRYPELTVEWVVSPGLSDMERLEADIAIRPVRPEASDNVLITRLRDSQFALFGARSLLERHGVDPDDPAALADAAAEGWAGFPWVGWSTEYAQLGLSKLLGVAYPDARIVLRAASLEPLRLAAMAGIGLLLTPSYFGRISPGLVALPARGLPGPRPIYLVGHAALRHVPRVDAVWTHLLECLRGSDEEQLDHGRSILTEHYAIQFDD